MCFFGNQILKPVLFHGQDCHPVSMKQKSHRGLSTNPPGKHNTSKEVRNTHAPGGMQLSAYKHAHRHPPAAACTHLPHTLTHKHSEMCACMRIMCSHEPCSFACPPHIHTATSTPIHTRNAHVGIRSTNNADV